MIVDLRLPGMSGIEICKQVRGASLKTPIIVLSAVGEEVDKVLLLEIGADDYVVKPFGARELLARIRAVLRRTSPEARKIAQFGIVAVDFERRVVTKRGEQLKLTPAEYNLLSYFLQNPDRPLTRDMILNLGPQHPATHGTLRLIVRLDGERVITADPVIGYMHRGYEKLTEFRTRTVDAHVVRLRQKLEADPNTPRHFLTVHGVGYRFLP